MSKTQRENDPYRDIKLYHKAGMINDKGPVSALCFDPPRPIRLGRQCWTLDDSAVTCTKCLKILEDRKTRERT
jgi:hypothetical protein